MVDNEFKVHVEFEKASGSLQFNTVKQVTEFIEGELEFWSWLNDGKIDTGGLGKTLYNNLRNDLIGAKNHLADVASNKDGVLKAVSQRFVVLFDQTGFPLSDSATASFLNDLKEKAPVSAAAALAAQISSGQLNLANLEHLEGVFQLFAFREKLSKRTSQATKAALELQEKRYREVVQKAQKEEAKRISTRDKADQEQRDLVAKTIRAARERVSTTRFIGHASVDAAIKRIDDTDVLYKEHMKLKASVDYWTTKATGHRSDASKYRGALGYFAVVGGAGLTIAVVWIANHLINIASNDAPSAVYFIWATLGLLISTIVFWAARILTRLYLSEHHLAIDAQERAVMVQTYLALTAEGAATDQERAIVLGSLFRPTADGIVKDDAAPDFSPAVLLSRFDPKP